MRASRGSRIRLDLLGEHHNNPVLYPAPLMGLAAVASRTQSIRLGTSVLYFPSTTSSLKPIVAGHADEKSL